MTPVSRCADPTTGPVVCDLDTFAVVDIVGQDAATFLQGQLSNDVNALTVGAAQYTSYNSPKGRMLANFLLWREPMMYRALLPADIADAVRKRLSMYVLRSKVKLADATPGTVRLGIGGLDASRAISAAFGAVPAPFAAATSGRASVLAVPGPRYIVIAPIADASMLREKLAEHAALASFDAWRWLTIRAGVPIITAATQDRFVAQAANWDVLGGVSFRKGCYTGQEIIARMQYLGRLKERLYLFHSQRAAGPGAPLFSRAFGDQPAGTVVDSAPAPAGGHDVLAVVQTGAADAGDVRLDAADTQPLAPEPLPYAVPPMEKRA